MQIGIIGAGKIGATVGRLWAKTGHKIRFATRHPEELTDLAKEIGENASVGPIKEATGAYIDERADDKQTEALGGHFRGNGGRSNGGPRAALW